MTLHQPKFPFEEQVFEITYVWIPESTMLFYSI